MTKRQQALSSRFFVLPAVCAGVMLALSPSASAGPAYRALTTSNPQSDSWRDGLTVNISMDVKRCKNSYGSNWAEECAATASW